MSIFTDQAEFMQAADQTTDRDNLKQSLMYADLVKEEFNEFVNADSFENAIKEALDIIVVTTGWLLSVGVDADEAWRRVHASNMSKLTDGKLLKRDDGKVLKGPNYKPADLSDLL